jgi:hypothetical protein
MKAFNWYQLHELACKTSGSWGVYISGSQFESLWELFVEQVLRLFPVTEAYNILGSVITEQLMLFETETEACKLYQIM